jgi:AcrR family transcriptional regulator
MGKGRIIARASPAIAVNRGAVPAASGSGRRERRAAETRLRLFHAALALFAERGFQNVKVEDITEAADVGKGTFFNYFPTKDHVLGVMAEIQLSRVHEAVHAAADGTESMRELLRKLALRLAEEPGRSPDLARAVVSAFLASNVVRSLIESQMKKGRALVARCVAQGQKRGEIDTGLKKSEIALHFQQAMMGTILLWSLNGHPALSKQVEGSFEHFWRAVESGRRN